MGTAAIKIKIMPDSPDANLDEIQRQAEQIIREQSLNLKTEREPIAFGLNAIIILFAWDEEASTDYLLEKLQKIKHVSSAEIIDFRRAVG